MDDELEQLEAELKRLQPAAPSRALVDRIERELEPAPAGKRQKRATVRWLWFAALPAAAAVALTVRFSREAAATSAPRQVSASPIVTAAPAEALKPVAAENVLYAAKDEGFVTLADGTPARRERLQYVDTITWKNPRTNASLKWTVPREEVRVVPVSFQ
jgi:hypothetical protein